MSEQQIVDAMARAIQAHDDNTCLLLDDSAGAVQAFYLELAERVWATVRAGVESGTIKGEVQDARLSRREPTVRWSLSAFNGGGTYLVIPVDRGDTQ